MKYKNNLHKSLADNKFLNDRVRKLEGKAQEALSKVAEADAKLDLSIEDRIVLQK